MMVGRMAEKMVELKVAQKVALWVGRMVETSVELLE